MRWRTVFLAAMTATGTASPVRALADQGVYFSQSLGVGMAKGDLEPTVGNAIESRLALGARVRWLAVEGWVESDVQTDREGGMLAGFAGGEPAAGRADLEAYGFALRAIAPLYRSPSGEKLEGYVRVGSGIVGGTGMLDGYRGMGVGASAGIALSGKVRALGFLWAPLFFVKKGPKVTGSLYFDQGWDFVRLEHATMPTLTARVGHVSIGFAVGHTF